MSQKTITRLEISEALAKGLGISRQRTSDVVDLVIHEMIEGLAKDKELKLSSFGTFVSRKKNARVGRNPKTGVEVTITPRQSVTFRASNTFKGKTI